VVLQLSRSDKFGARSQSASAVRRRVIRMTCVRAVSASRASHGIRYARLKWVNGWGQVGGLPAPRSPTRWLVAS
jgi:hypothetical protein